MPKGASSATPLTGLLACALAALALTAGVTPAAASGGWIAAAPATMPDLSLPAAPGDRDDRLAAPVGVPPSTAASAGRDPVWTREDMLGARPADPPGALPSGPAGAGTSGTGSRIRNAAAANPAEVIPNPGAFPYRAHGKLFFRIGDPDQPGGNEYVCSGTLVSSRGRNVMITAGHCVVDPPTATGTVPDWGYDHVFVPAYSDGTAPYGEFSVIPGATITTRGWRDFGDIRYDVAAVALNPNALGRAERAVGARKIEFGGDFTGRSVELFGHPTQPEPQFDGERLIRCVPASLGQDPLVTDPLRPHMAWPCDMTFGASGGGWILDGRYLASITSYGHEDMPSMSRRLFGPQFGSAALNVYTAGQIGGSVDPTVKMVKRPPHRVRKRAVNFRVRGNGSTPLLFKVKLDRKKPVYTGNLIKVRKLSIGRHVLRIRSIDQTGRLSPKTLIRKVRVLPKKKRRLRRR